MARSRRAGKLAAFLLASFVPAAAQTTMILGQSCGITTSSNDFVSPMQQAAHVFRLASSQWLNLTTVTLYSALGYSDAQYAGNTPRIRISLFPAQLGASPWVRPDTAPVAAAEFLSSRSMGGSMNYSLTDNSSWVWPQAPFVVGTHIADTWAISVQWLTPNTTMTWQQCVTATSPIAARGMSYMGSFRGSGAAPSSWYAAPLYGYINVYASNVGIAPTPTQTPSGTPTGTYTPSGTPSALPTQSAVPFGVPVTIMDNSMQQSASLMTGTYSDPSSHGYGLALTNTDSAWQLSSISLCLMDMMGPGNSSRTIPFTITLYTASSSGWVLNPPNSIVASVNVSIMLQPYAAALRDIRYQTIDLGGQGFLMDPRISVNYAITWRSTLGDANWGYKGLSVDTRPSGGRGFNVLNYLLLNREVYTSQSGLFAACWLQGIRSQLPTPSPTGTLSGTGTPAPTPASTYIAPSASVGGTPSSTPAMASIGSITTTLKFRGAAYARLQPYTRAIADAAKADIANYFVTNISWPRPPAASIQTYLGMDYFNMDTATSLTLTIPIPPAMIDALYPTVRLMATTFMLDPYVTSVFGSTLAVIKQIVANNTVNPAAAAAAVNMTCANAPYSTGSYSASPWPIAEPSPPPPTTAIVMPLVFTGMNYALVAPGTPGNAYVVASVRADIFTMFSLLGIVIDPLRIVVTIRAASRRLLLNGPSDQLDLHRELQTAGGVAVTATVPFAEPAPNTAAAVSAAIQSAVAANGANTFTATATVYASQVSPGSTFTASVAAGGVAVDPAQANANGGSGGGSTAGSSSGGSGAGAIAGGVVGAIAGVVICVVVYFVVIRPRLQRKRAAMAQKPPTGQQAGTTMGYAPTAGAHVQMAAIVAQPGTTIIITGAAQQQQPQDVSMMNPMAAKRMTMAPGGGNVDGAPPSSYTTQSGYAPTPIL